MARQTIIYWRDIPSQVVVKHRRESAKVRLSDRFQEAIDRAAMRAGKGSSDAYLEEWRREISDCAPGDLQEIANATAAKLEDSFSDERLRLLIRQHGAAEA